MKKIYVIVEYGLCREKTIACKADHDSAMMACKNHRIYKDALVLWARDGIENKSLAPEDMQKAQNILLEDYLGVRVDAWDVV